MVAFIFSCNTPSTNPTAANGQSREEKNMANNRKVYTAIETGDMSPIDSLVAPDLVDHDANGRELKGKDSIMNMLADIHNHISNLKLDVISSAADGDYVFTLVHTTGTTSDSSMGMPGRSIDEKGVDVVKFNKDDKATDHWGFTEDEQVMKEMKEMSDRMNMNDNSKMKK